MKNIITSSKRSPKNSLINLYKVSKNAKSMAISFMASGFDSH